MKEYIVILLIFLSNLLQAQVKPISPVISNKNVAMANNAAGITRYRITINGFSVNHPTADHILEVDGKGDEVYFYSYAQKFNSTTGDRIGERTLRGSLIFGDINNDGWRRGERIRAGSKAGQQGGLDRTDRFPTNEPWKQNNKPNIRTVPFIISEGTIQKNETVMAVPSIWEYDGTTEFEQGLNAFLSDLTKITLVGAGTAAGFFIIGPAALPIIPAFAGVIDLQVNAQQDVRNEVKNHEIFVKVNPPNTTFNTGVNKTLFGDAKDRPIGMEDVGGHYEFAPIGMKLTYNDMLLYAALDFGLGKGVIPVRYKDAPQLEGDYTLYIQIEVSENNKPLQMDDRFNPFETTQAKNRYKLINAHDNSTITADKDANVNVLNGYANMEWELVKVPNTSNQYYILNQSRQNNKPGTALDVLGHSMDNNGPVILYGQNKALNQRWYIIPLGDGSFSIIAVESGKALCINFNTGKLVQWENRANPDQRWKIE